MIVPNQETLKKLTGDITDEAPEAYYRLWATTLVNIVEVEGIDRLDDDNPIKRLRDQNERLGEAVVSFGVAAVLEFLPTSILGESRKRLAYNLRVRTYERLGEALVGTTPLIKYIEDMAERARRIANGELAKPDQSSDKKKPNKRAKTVQGLNGAKGASDRRNSKSLVKKQVIGQDMTSKSAVSSEPESINEIKKNQ